MTSTSTESVWKWDNTTGNENKRNENTRLE